MKGRDATVGCLLDAFERSGQKRISDNLLGMKIYFYRPRKRHVMIDLVNTICKQYPSFRCGNYLMLA